MVPRSATKGKGKAQNTTPVELYRYEIEQRTVLGESCEQIAAALQAKGVNTSATTISRRRQQWGLRQKSSKNSTGANITKPRSKAPMSKAAAASARRAEIEHRTRNGQTAEQVAEALQAQGFELERGASTIMRLQTVWGLVQRDPEHAKARRKSKAAERVKEAKPPKISRRDQEREANREQQNSTMHYPTNCSFGPKKRKHADHFDDLMDMATEVVDSSYVPTATTMSPPPSQEGDAETLQDVSAEVMSVDILIDLATSTLSAARNLKDMLLTYQCQDFSSNSFARVPTTLNDLANARKKVREAAGLMLDLAADPGV